MRRASRAGGRAFLPPAAPGTRPSGRSFRHPRRTLSIPAALLRTWCEPEKADSGLDWWAEGGSLGLAERSRPAPPPVQPLAATERVDPQPGAFCGSSPVRSRLGGPRRSRAAPGGCWQVGAGREKPRLRSLGRSLSNPAPGSHAGRAVTLPLRARLRGAMDAALLHSLLEANCSLELAEELVLDGWGLPLHSEGRREPSRPGRRGLLAWRVGCAQVPALERLAPCVLRRPAGPSSLSDPRSALSHHQVPTPTATRPWTRSGRAGPGARPEPWWRGRAPSTSTESSTTRPVSVPGTLRRGLNTWLPAGRFRG